MSTASGLKMGNDDRPSVLPTKVASGPGFLGPPYSPADEMLPPASIGVRRGDSIDSVIGAVKGVIYYGDMIGFGEASSSFTQGMPGLKPLGVNYFMNSGLQCSNGATMWEYVQTIPTGNALGQKIKSALRGVGLPALRGMAPGIMEDAQAALNPFPVINAVVGSGYPQCRLVRMPVGDIDGKIQNVDGNLLVDPTGLLVDSNGRYYQEQWIQDRKVPPVRRTGETATEQFLRGDPIQLSYEDWSKAPKVFKENGCLDMSAKNVALDTIQPFFCKANPNARQVITLGDGTQVTAYTMNANNGIQTMDGFEDLSSPLARVRLKPTALFSVSVAVLSILGLVLFLKKR